MSKEPKRGRDVCEENALSHGVPFEVSDRARSLFLENPKYRTPDSPPFVEPEVIWPPSLTDPSQTISVERLVANHVRSGVRPVGYFGTDYSRLGFAELVELEKQLSRDLESKELEEKDRKQKAAELQKAKQQSLKVRLLQQLKAGSPELQQLAAELTGTLPGFGADVADAEGGSSKA